MKHAHDTMLNMLFHYSFFNTRAHPQSLHYIFSCDLTFCLHCTSTVSDTGLDCDIQHLNHYPLDKYYQSLLTCPEDSDFSNEYSDPADTETAEGEGLEGLKP